MNLSALTGALRRSDRFQQTLREIRDGKRVPISVADTGKPYIVAALHEALQIPLCLVAPRPNQARRFVDDLLAWHPRPESVIHFPVPDALPYEHLAYDAELTSARMQALRALSTPNAAPLIVLAARSALDCLIDPPRFRAASRELRPGTTVSPARLMEDWLELGYEPSPVVDGPGQFGRRGGIVDVFPPGQTPCRIEFWGDEIESLRVFDPATQRSGETLESLTILPADERGGNASILDFLPEHGMVVLDESRQIEAATRELEQQAEHLHAELLLRNEWRDSEAPPYRPWAEVLERIDAQRCLTLSHDPDSETVEFIHPGSFAGRHRALVAEAHALRDRGHQIVIVSQQSARLAEVLNEAGVVTVQTDEVGELAPAADAPVPLVHGSLQDGWRSDELHLTIFTDRELFGWAKEHRQTRRARRTAREAFLSDLEPGTLVVHIDHGIGRYLGLARLTAPGAKERNDGEAGGREFLLLQFADSDRLYVPVDQADRVSRYIGGGEQSPRLTRLASGEWARSKQRVQRAVRLIAQDLIELYAAREVSPGHGYPADSVWQSELEAAFPYVETPDQVTAIGEVKRDMEQPRPMDRLLVGDVGYGKTEVALRAAFKAVMDGRQVAVLVPTTVLAQQHYSTFKERLEAFPVRVESLSRFRSEKEQHQVVSDLAEGAVDIVIGTHRLVQKDVKFKDLGLVIIDEEQRFGVTHKERLKQLRREVDVLTLTATPIPRTLHMALVGVRDLSSIETAPEARLPIRTYVLESDDAVIREAIIRELERGGQIYFVHNRVRTIAAVANRLAELVPEARIGVGHGQMSEGALEQTMVQFAAGEYDVLVCTTIIESGLDIPNVNTMILDHAERFGLAQLYQLRGRIGRAGVRAYAYLLYPRDTQLTEIAEKRLRTIFEATELGAGYHIAMKDLEIRGAGNLLGSEQHGHIAAVGFDLYCRLLAEAVDSLRALRAAPADRPPVLDGGAPAASVSLPLPAYLPTAYVPDDSQRLRLYQRLAAVRTFEELGGFFDELEDRYGKLPDVAENLAYLVRLRLAATDAGIREIDADNERIVLRFRG
ncbi:MAG TPA: transcription-repair coupling factor, partial [Chloroflexota bacterium]|nr:transcription-repair coupling factor [Chloroflexota bacterium]